MARHTPHHQTSPAAKRPVPTPQGLPAGDAIAAFDVSQEVAAQSKEAQELATRLASVFASVFEPRPGKRKLVASGSRVFVAVHESGNRRSLRLSFNRDAAATLAAQPVTAGAIKQWFDATGMGMERRKDLFLALHVHPSTLSRAGPKTEMDASVTERMLRHSDLLVRAAEVFGEDGKTWLTKPHDLLGGKTPMEFAGNEFGGAKVRAMLDAIEYGGVV